MGSSEYIDVLMGQRGSAARANSRPAISVQLAGRANAMANEVMNGIINQMMRPDQRVRPIVRDIVMMNRPGEGQMFNLNAEPFFPDRIGIQLPR